MTDEQTKLDEVSETYPTDDRHPDTATEAADSSGSGNDEPDTFPREYVEQLRREAAELRVKAKDRDTLAQELFASRVAATGRLADPTDLPFDDALLNDMPALEAAIENLLATKPHLAARTPVGDIGQGVHSTDTPVDLAGLLRGAL